MFPPSPAGPANSNSHDTPRQACNDIQITAAQTLYRHADHGSSQRDAQMVIGTGNVVECAG
jgi:hypothetical protein